MRISDWSSDVCTAETDASPGGHLRRRAAGGLLREFLEPFFDLLDDDPRDVCADHAAAVVTGLSAIATHVLVEREIGRMYRRKIIALVADDQPTRPLLLPRSKTLPTPAPTT